VIERAFENVQAVVALFTPDERVRGRDSLKAAGDRYWRLQARPDVLIEAGMALVTQPGRIVFVVLGTQELPSDLAGLYYIHLDGTAGQLNALATALEDAGCEVDRTGTRWLDPTRFPRRDGIPSKPANAAE
jgi:predicted nucleotide-binding protein